VSGPWIAAFTALCVMVVVLALIVLGTLRGISTVLAQVEEQIRRCPLQPQGLSSGTPVPNLEAERPDGSKFTTSDLRSAPSVVLFLSSSCRPCHALATELSSNRIELYGARLFVVLNDWSDAEDLDLNLDGSVEILYQVEGSVSHAFGSNATPHAFAIDAEGRVVSQGTPNSLTRLKALARSIGEGGVNESNPSRVALSV
jgi:peroxiredoxin